MRWTHHVEGDEHPLAAAMHTAAGGLGAGFIIAAFAALGLAVR
jgi:hypothetical protein